MPSKLPYFPFYPRDFSADSKVEAMSTEEVGAYLLLLCKAWFEDPVGSIPSDDTILARWARLDSAAWARCRPSVLSCFSLGADGRYYQKRMRNEYAKLRSVRKAKSEGGKRSAEKKRLKAQAGEGDFQDSYQDSYQDSCKTLGNRNARPVSVSDSGSGSPGKGGPGGKPAEPSGFERFWAAYPRQVDRLDAAQVWYELAPDEKLLAIILEAVERQKKTDQWQRGVIPNPDNWLAKRRWEDEVPLGLFRPAEPPKDYGAATAKRRAEMRENQRRSAGGGA